MIIYSFIDLLQFIDDHHRNTRFIAFDPFNRIVYRKTRLYPSDSGRINPGNPYLPVLNWNRKADWI